MSRKWLSNFFMSKKEGFRVSVSGKINREELGLSRVANRFHLLSQFSSIGNGFLDGCPENVLMTVSQCRPQALTGLGVMCESWRGILFV